LKTKNQLVVLSGLFVLIAAGTIAVAASNIVVQPVKAAFGKDVVAPHAQEGKSGQIVSNAAHDLNGFGVADFRANGFKPTGSNDEDYNNGQCLAEIDPHTH